jgi:MFS family permease
MSAEAVTGLSLPRHRPFVFFWSARVFASLAVQIFAVAVGWQIYELTDSALDLGFVGLAQFLPSFVLFPIVGHVADRYHRQTIVLICQWTAGTAVALIALGTVSGWITRDLIFVLVAMIGAARAFEHPTTQSMLPGLVPAAMLSRAIAAAATAFQSATIAGPAVGGLLLLMGPSVTYFVCATFYITAGVLIYFVEVIRAPPMREPASLRVIFAGIAFIRRHPLVLGAISLDMFAVLLGGATALLPIYARDIFQTGPWGLGLLRAAPAVGALAMAAWLARHPLERHVGKAMLISVAIFGLATIVFGYASTLPLAAVALFVLGASDMISIVVRQTLIQLATPDDMRGRVGAVNSMFVGTSNQLGEFRSGVTAAWLGAVASVVVGGIGTLVIVALWAKLFPPLRKIDRFSEIQSGDASG